MLNNMLTYNYRSGPPPMLFSRRLSNPRRWFERTSSVAILRRARLVSSENFHWTRQDLDTCPKVVSRIQRVQFCTYLKMGTYPDYLLNEFFLSFPRRSLSPCGQLKKSLSKGWNFLKTSLAIEIVNHLEML